MTRHVWWMALALAASAPSVTAQDLLSLENAVQSTLARNAALGAARAGAAEAGEQAVAARSGFFPRVSVTESWQRGDQPVFVFSSLLSARRFGADNFAIDSLNHPTPLNFLRTSVGVEQLIFDGGRQRAASASATFRRDIAGTAVDEAAAALALAATETFGRVLAAQALLRAARSGVEAGQEDLRRTEARRDAGMATDADVLALVVHVADLRQRAIRADGDAAIARAELNRLMGEPIAREFVAAEPVFDPGSAAPASDVATLLAEADAARPELRRAAAAAQLTESERRGARAMLVPQIAAQGAFDLSGTSFSDRASSWIVGTEFRWSFSTGGAELARIKAAAHAAARTTAENEDVRAAVHVEVVSAHRRLQAAGARVEAGRAAVEQARESQRIIRDRFEAGLTGVNDVLRASTTVLDAESARVTALVDALVSDAMLRRAVGRQP
jgi:outer membrane protein TolC